MFRKTSWRNTVSNAVSLHQDQALSTTIFLLKTFGPTGFLLREEGEAKNFRVCLGNPHTCTCPVFTKELEPCKHICWVLLRKFRLPREHEYSFQCGLVERQILEVLQGLHQTKDHQTENDPSAASGTPSQEDGSVRRKVIQAHDVCPICHEELLEKKWPVSYCRFSCGNNVHISCMKVWADHQSLSNREETVKCPLCRENFCSLKFLQEQVKNAAKSFTAAEREKPDKHLGVACHSCRICPVTGNCFKCTVCRYFYLCEDCTKKGRHPNHPLASRTKRRGKWQLVAQNLSAEPQGATSQPADDSVLPVAADHLPEHVLERLPSFRVRARAHLLDVGHQCRICLQNFSLGQRVRALPCRHQFHTDCVDEILRKSNSCPLDGYVIYDPQTWKTSQRKTSPKLASCRSSNSTKQPESNLTDLFVPGVALLDREVAPSRPEKSITDRFEGLCLATETVVKKGKPNHLGKSDSSAGSPQKMRKQPQPELCVDVQKLEAEHTATPTRRKTRSPPKRLIKDRNKRPTSEPRMSGVLTITKQERKTEI